MPKRPSSPGPARLSEPPQPLGLSHQAVPSPPPGPRWPESRQPRRASPRSRRPPPSGSAPPWTHRRGR
ncbi:MAG: hypothetical protein MZU79_02345 [Anaerotruncus sp.]|nr:hypothetical protein [Anaerotruncus sp.]